MIGYCGTRVVITSSMYSCNSWAESYSRNNDFNNDRGLQWTVIQEETLNTLLRYTVLYCTVLYITGKLLYTLENELWLTLGYLCI